MLSAALVDEALGKLAFEGIEPRTVVLDEGWHRAMGDWQADNARFKGSLRRFIAHKHKAGYHVLLAFNPFLAAEDSTLAREHADWLIRDDKGEPLRAKRCGRSYVLPDWSVSAVRRHMAARLRGMLAPAGLDADGIKLVGAKFIPPAAAALAGPKFGQGERYLLGVMRSVKSAVRAAKPDAPVEIRPNAIRAAMPQRMVHPLDQRFWGRGPVETVYPADAEHF
jgi:alpha-galactosidase